MKVWYLDWCSTPENAILKCLNKLFVQATPLDLVRLRHCNGCRTVIGEEPTGNVIG